MPLTAPRPARPFRHAAAVALAAAVSALLAACAGPSAIVAAPGTAGVHGPSDCVDADLASRLVAQRQQLFQAMERGDRATLEALLAPDFTFTHASGHVEARQAFIDHAVRNAKGAGAMAGHAITFLDDDLRWRGADAIAWAGRSASQFPGEGVVVFRGDDVLVRQDGRWRWRVIRSTRATGAAAAPLPVPPRGCAVRPAPAYSHG